LDDHSTLALNSHAGKRRGYYGEYLFDVPAQVRLQALDASGNSLAGVLVEVFQKDAQIEEIDNIAEFSGSSDAQGKVLLTDHPVTGATTATGHQLVANVWGQIDVVNRNAVAFVRFSRCGSVAYRFLHLADLNLAYWRGQAADATIPFNLPELGASCPPSPTPSATATLSPTPSMSPSSTMTPSLSPTNTPSPSATPTPMTGTATATPTPTPLIAAFGREGAIRVQPVPQPWDGRGRLRAAVLLDHAAPRLHWWFYESSGLELARGQEAGSWQPGWQSFNVELPPLANGSYWICVRSDDGDKRSLSRVVVLR
jgi:hypothetical protein